MDSQLLTLSKIFAERLFRIPDYQRGYAWGDRQLRDFWSDIAQLEVGHNHYTGVLTMEHVASDVHTKWHDDSWIINSKNYEPFYIVDGQQRLTTAIILVQCIIEKMDDIEILNYTNRSDIQKKFIFESRDKSISRSYIFGYEKDNPSYNYLKANIFGERIQDRIEETVYTQNFQRAKAFFAEKIGGFSVEDLSIIYKKVTQNLLFNIFTISAEVDVCVAFETMNNRGKPLSYLELLKNRLIYLSLKFDEPDFEREKLRRAINDCWKAIYHSLGRNKSKPLDDDKFLLAHYLTYFRRKPKHKIANEENFNPIPSDSIKPYADKLLNEIFITRNIAKDVDDEDRISLLSVYDYVRSLQDSVELWFALFNPETTEFSAETKLWLDRLNRLRADWYLPLMLVVLQTINNERDRVNFLKSIERQLFLGYLFSQFQFLPAYRYMGGQAVKLAVGLKDKSLSLEAVVKQINENTHKVVTEGQKKVILANKFKSLGFYNWPMIRYFLFEYNLDLQKNSKTNREKIVWSDFIEDKNDYVTVEHIFPQKSNDVYWATHFGKFTPKQKSQLRQYLGNLLPLSRPKNASLSNKPFPEKARSKTGQFISYQYGSYSENEVAHVLDWTPQQILERGLRLLSFLERRWDVKLGTDDEKALILGLAFLKQHKDHRKI